MLIFFFQNFLNLMNIPEMHKEIRKSLLFLRYWCLKLLREILHIATDIPVIGRQYANKQSQDFRSD